MSTTDVPHALRQRIREAARDRCGYCLSSQRYVMATLEIEHLIPRALGGTEDESNLFTSRRFWTRSGMSESSTKSQPQVLSPILLATPL